ncbi:MAG: sulfite exporter TauE/SafE family protein [Ruminococcus sp.]|nr:sulfite exporter TauE/SafE family protein [Ruminococcus sp.]MCM1479344.1 sulfite exporter TauE/SafE family protein [Muribaculaceae bacterium]
MIWQFAAAFFTGIFASLGVGGGMILIIYLTVFAGFDQLSAQGINLIYFIPIAALSVAIHTKNKLIEWKKIVPSIIIGVIFAAGGTYAAEKIGSPALKKIFAIFILLIGIKELLYKPKHGGSCDKQDTSQE